MRMVEVRWRDCHALTDGWTCLSELDVHDRIIVSVGFLVDDAKIDHLVLVQSVDEENVDNAIAIPMAVVVSVRSLTIAD